MKSIFLIISFVFAAFFGNAQVLSFDQKFYDALDKWVVFEGTGNPKKHLVGFVYLDEQAGISFRHHASLLEREGGIILVDPITDAIIAARLDSRTVDLAILSDKQLQELKLPKEPNWLSVYKVNEQTDKYQVAKGRAYNAAGVIDLALPILLKVYEKNPHLEGLEFELAYAYNHIGSFYKAVVVLNKAIENDPDNFWYYRELGFSFKHLNNLKEAERIYLKGIDLSNDNYQKAEMAINMVQSFFHVKDRKKFDEWVSILKKYADEDSQFLDYIPVFEERWDMQREK